MGIFKRIQVTTRIDGELIKEIKILAVKQGRRTNLLIEDALKAYLASHKKKPTL